MTQPDREFERQVPADTAKETEQEQQPHAVPDEKQLEGLTNKSPDAGTLSDDELVGEASEDSFPASDSPAWTSTTKLGPDEMGSE